MCPKYWKIEEKKKEPTEKNALSHFNWKISSFFARPFLQFYYHSNRPANGFLSHLCCIENSSSNRDRWLEFVDFLFLIVIVIFLSSFSFSLFYVPAFLRHVLCVQAKIYTGLLLMNKYTETRERGPHKRKKLRFVWSFSVRCCLWRKVSKHNGRKPLFAHQPF